MIPLPTNPCIMSSKTSFLLSIFLLWYAGGVSQGIFPEDGAVFNDEKAPRIDISIHDDFEL
jgi:hypothetical protein